MPTERRTMIPYRLRKNRRTAVALVLLLSFFAASGAQGTSLVSTNLDLHIPWVSLGDATYEADLAYDPAVPGIAFRLTGARLRPVTPPAGLSATLEDGGTLHLPLVQAVGELFTVDLLPGEYEGDLVFFLDRAAPAPVDSRRGRIESATLLSSMTGDQVFLAYFLSGLLPPSPDGVSLYKVVYNTVDPFGRPTLASGLMAIPHDLSSPRPIAAFQHGTETLHDEAPSNDPLDLAGTILGASGYVTAVPDFLGFGESSGLHPYVHAKSLATAVIDMIRAVRHYCEENTIALDDRLFLAGYSEGGYATMAAHREIETYHGDEFTVTASAPAAGPYDLSGTMLTEALTGPPAPNPYYFPYTLLGYNEVYGLADAAGTLFAPPYDETIPPLFDGTHSGSEINAALPAEIRDALNPDFLDTVEDSATSPWRTALEQNDVYRWVPQAPTHLYHCTDDRDVPVENSEVAYTWMKAHGAARVELHTLTAGGHVECVLPILLQIKTWFDSVSADGGGET